LALQSADLRLRSSTTDGGSAAALARDALSVIEWSSGAGGWALLPGGMPAEVQALRTTVAKAEKVMYAHRKYFACKVWAPCELITVTL